MTCQRWAGLEWVWENHPDRPWAEPGKYPNSCDCGAGAPCPVCNPLHRDQARAETVDDLVAAVIAERERLRTQQPDAGPDPIWTAALNAFGADIVNRVLPDDPTAQAAIIRKAQAFGIDIGPSEIARKMNRSSNALRLHTKKVAQAEPPAPTPLELGLKAKP